MQDAAAERIMVAGPSITDKEVAYVADAAARCWGASANEYHDRFESAFAKYIGVKHAIALPSCTAAIHLALVALEISRGDEVIVPDVTWIASAAPIEYVGAQPVFADIDATTWCISAEAFERAITRHTKAVIALDLYGGMPDLTAIRQIAKSHGIAVIEDAAEAIGSELNGARAGSLGDVGVFSFHGSKTMTTGEGGMLVTDDDHIHRRVLFLRDHGRTAGDKMFWNSEVAYKYRMSAVQAALGLAQLERIDELVGQKRRIFAWYDEAFAGTPGLALNAEPVGVKNSYWMATTVFDSRNALPKERLIAALAERRIDSRPFFYPLSSLPAYCGTPGAARAQLENKTSYRISPYGINLPCGMQMTETKVRRVVDAVKEIISAADESAQAA